MKHRDGEAWGRTLCFPFVVKKKQRVRPCASARPFASGNMAAI